MRVLEVLQPESGGVPVHVLALSRGLKARGIDVEVATCETSAIRAPLEENGIPVHVMPFSGTPGRFRSADVAAAPRLRELDRRGGYDVLHAHSAKAGALVRGAVSRPRRVVYTPHCFAFAAQFGRGQSLVYRAIEQALVPRTGTIVAACEWERGVAGQLAGAASRVRVIEYGVPPCAPAEPDAGVLAFKGDAPLAGFLARLNEQKDPLTAVRAMRTVADRGVEGRLAVVGNGPLDGAVDAEIRALGLEGRVARFPFAGDVGPYLHAFDVFTLSSAWEALPIGMLEAMRCGLPIVSTTAGGVGDAVDEGVNGSLVPTRDPARLGEALARVLADPEGLARMARAARERAEVRFDVDRMVDDVAELYRATG